MRQYSRSPTANATAQSKRTVASAARFTALWLVIAGLGHSLAFAANPPAAFSVDVTREAQANPSVSLLRVSVAQRS